MDNLTRKQNALIVTAILLVVAFALSFISPATVAYADMPSSYNDYISSLPSEDAKDWYFGSDYLDLNAAKAIVNAWKNDKSFDWESLKNDPIVIAVVDSGIGYAYTVKDGVETESSVKDVYKDGTSYKISDVFNDVLLTDKDGKYVYKNTTGKVKIVDGNSTVTQTAITNSGNIALDLVDNTDNNHGTHVTGIVALLIRAFGLEDYVKILPIKANNKISKASGKTQFTASYDNGNADPVITNALYFAQENGADIVNLSLAAEYSARGYYTFDAFDNEMLIVAAAGNDGKDSNWFSRQYYPAACSNVIGVMNYTFDDDGNAVVAPTSNYGSSYNLAAPGAKVISIIDGDDGYGKLSGTSMASPIVSFCSALTLLRYRGIESKTGIEMSTEILRAMVNASPTTYTADSKAQPLLNLKNLLTADFLNDETYADMIYTTTTGVKITGSVSSKLVLGGDDVKFRAVPIPSNAKTNYGVRWYLQKGETKIDLGTGVELNMEVPSEVGEGYALYCEYYDESTSVTEFVSEPFTFSVNYKEFDSADITGFTVDENGRNGAIFSLDVTGYKPTIADGIVWYVDGKEVGRGATFEYSTQTLTVGSHNVTASVWGAKVDFTYTLIVEGNAENNVIGNVVYAIIGGVICGIAVLLCAAILTVNNVKKKKYADEESIDDVVYALDESDIVPDEEVTTDDENTLDETKDAFVCQQENDCDKNEELE